VVFDFVSIVSEVLLLLLLLKSLFLESKYNSILVLKKHFNKKKCMIGLFIQILNNLCLESFSFSPPQIPIKFPNNSQTIPKQFPPNVFKYLIISKRKFQTIPKQFPRTSQISPNCNHLSVIVQNHSVFRIRFALANRLRINLKNWGLSCVQKKLNHPYHEPLGKLFP
jgi:hypothetical protein